MTRSIALILSVAAGAVPALAAEEGSTTLANPSAEFCIAQGGAYDIRETAEGQIGICVFPDGREVNAWEYFRENAPGQDG